MGFGFGFGSRVVVVCWWWTGVLGWHFRRGCGEGVLESTVRIRTDAAMEGKKPTRRRLQIRHARLIGGHAASRMT